VGYSVGEPERAASSGHFAFYLLVSRDKGLGPTPKEGKSKRISGGIRGGKEFRRGKVMDLVICARRKKGPVRRIPNSRRSCRGVRKQEKR